MKTRIFSFLLAVALLCSIPFSANAAGASDFKDVKPTAWYYSAVDYAVQNNLFKGVSATTFAPNQAMTRAMFVTVLGRMAGVAETYGSGTASPFVDMQASQYFFPYALWCNEKGIVMGVGSGKFSPDLSISRQDMAAILFRYAQNAGLNTTIANNKFSAFPDAGNVSGYAVVAMKWATAHGIINGTDGKLDPKGNATRAQVAQILLNFKSLTAFKDPFQNLDSQGRPTGKSTVDANGGYYDYDLANSVMDLVNNLRASSGTTALSFHINLQKLTTIRSKEASAKFDHTRPDGSQWYTVGGNLNGENLANTWDRGTTAANAGAIYTAWLNSSGHKENMLKTSFKTAAVSCYVLNGRIYSTHLFSSSASSVFN